jgi:hypothetical protein
MQEHEDREQGTGSREQEDGAKAGL